MTMIEKPLEKPAANDFWSKTYSEATYFCISNYVLHIKLFVLLYVKLYLTMLIRNHLKFSVKKMHL